MLTFLVVLGLLGSVQLLLLTRQLSSTLWKYFLCTELDLPRRYGEGSWVIITGHSSGQGRLFALHFAQRGFNLLLLGSERCHRVAAELQAQFPLVQTKVIILDFGRAFADDFFVPIEKEINLLGDKISILINNVGQRTAWIDYEKMPSALIRSTIACGTIVQARLTQLVLPGFLARTHKSAIVFITAQCQHPTFALGITLATEISLPYLSVYEAANAFGFYHANSIYEEYSSRLDLLNITPGAVVTENTPYLRATPFRIDSAIFVAHVLRLMGNVSGRTCAYWGHALAVLLINFAPWKKKKILRQTGSIIAQHYMDSYSKTVLLHKSHTEKHE